MKIKVDLKDIEIGDSYTNQLGKSTRFYSEGDIYVTMDYLENIIQEARESVDLLVVGFMPILMAAKLTSFCKDMGVMSFSYAFPGGVTQRVYDDNDLDECNYRLSPGEFEADIARAVNIGGI